MDKHDDDLVVIRRIVSEWRAGWNHGDANALLSLYAENPVLMPQGQSIIYDRETIRSMYAAVFKDYIIEGEGEVIKAEISGDLGYLVNVYALTAKPKAGGEPTTSKGKSIFIFKRENNNWKIICLMDNSNEE